MVRLVCPCVLLAVWISVVGAPCVASAESRLLLDRSDPFFCFLADGEIDGSDFGVFIGGFQTSPTGGPPYACGDFDQDGDVDGGDFGVFIGLVHGTVSPFALDSEVDDDPVLPGDFDGAELRIFVDGFQRVYGIPTDTTAIPEPATLTLLLSVALLRRPCRRRWHVRP